MPSILPTSLKTYPIRQHAGAFPNRIYILIFSKYHSAGHGGVGGGGLVAASSARVGEEVAGGRSQGVLGDMWEMGRWGGAGCLDEFGGKGKEIERCVSGMGRRQTSAMPLPRGAEETIQAQTEL